MLVVMLCTRFRWDDCPGRKRVLFPARSLVHSRGHMVKAQNLRSAWEAGLPFHK